MRRRKRDGEIWHTCNTPFSWPWAMRVCAHAWRCAKYAVSALCAEKLCMRQVSVCSMPRNKMEDLNVNSLTWWMLMSVTLNAAIHLGKEYLGNYGEVDQRQKRISRFFDDRLAPTFLTKDNFVHWQSNSAIDSKNVCIDLFSIVYGQSESKSHKPWKEQIEWFMTSSQCRELDRIEAESTEFEWKISQDSLHYRLSPRSRKWWLKYIHVNVQRHNMVRTRKQKNAHWESKNSGRMCKKIRARTLVVSRASIRKENGAELTRTSRTEWDHVAEDMMINFSESGHPVFRGSSAFERGSLRSKRGGKLSIHLCGKTDTVEVVFRTIISVNQLSV